MYKERSAMREAIRQEGYRKMVRRDYDLNDIFLIQNKLKM